MATTILAVVVGTLVLISLAAFFRKAVRADGATRLDEEWFGQFSMESYRPMTRLLAEEDYRFLELQRGYEP